MSKSPFVIRRLKALKLFHNAGQKKRNGESSFGDNKREQNEKIFLPALKMPVKTNYRADIKSFSFANVGTLELSYRDVSLTTGFSMRTLKRHFQVSSGSEAIQKTRNVFRFFGFEEAESKGITREATVSAPP